MSTNTKEHTKEHKKEHATDIKDHSKEHKKEHTKEHKKEHATDIKDHSKEHKHKKEHTTDIKEHSKERKHKKEHATDIKEHSKERKHKTAKKDSTDVVVERVELSPIIIEHHHHHTHTVIHPEVVREHDTTEIRQIIKPVYEYVKSGSEEEYAEKEVRVVERAEDVAEAKRRLDAHHRDILAKADVTHTEHKTKTVEETKVKDVHAAHKVIEEVTPVIVRDVEHNKTVHKDEMLVEKIQHAPEIHKEELDIKLKEEGMVDTHGLKEGHTKETLAVEEGDTKGSHGIKEKKHLHAHLDEGHTKDTLVLKEGKTKDTTGLKEQTKETKLKEEVPTHHDARPDH